MFQTVAGSTLYFHPEVLRELFRKGRPLLRRSGTAADDADLPKSADIHTHIYMRDNRDVLRCFAGMSWTFNVACVVTKTTPTDATEPAPASGAPPPVTQLTRRCYVYRVVDRQPCDRVRGPLLSAEATVDLMEHVDEPLLEPLRGEEVPSDHALREHASRIRGSSAAAAPFVAVPVLEAVRPQVVPSDHAPREHSPIESSLRLRGREHASRPAPPPDHASRLRGISAAAAPFSTVPVLEAGRPQDVPSDHVPREHTPRHPGSSAAAAAFVPDSSLRVDEREHASRPAEDVSPEHVPRHRGRSALAASYSVRAPRNERVSASGSSAESGSGAPCDPDSEY